MFEWLLIILFTRPLLFDEARAAAAGRADLNVPRLQHQVFGALRQNPTIRAAQDMSDYDLVVIGGGLPA